MSATTKKKMALAPPKPGRFFKTQFSTWTPISHKPSNEQSFVERTELVTHWFDLWTDSQRKRFLDTIMRHCSRSQLIFLTNWFQERVPLRHLDFTTVLPQFLSLYIFSFLDPRSLCRASMVSWHWKFITEQDNIWIEKCVVRGWYLPYTPGVCEYSAWKRHYIACVQSLDKLGPSKDISALYGRDNEVDEKMNKKNSKLKKKTMSKSVKHWMQQSRPPWMDPDKKAMDISDQSLYRDAQLNDSIQMDSVRKSATKDKWTTILNTLPENDIEHSVYFEMESARTPRPAVTPRSRKVKNMSKLNLSQIMEIQNLEEKRLQCLMDQPWEPPSKKIIRERASLAGGVTYGHVHNDVYNHAKNFPNLKNPRIIFISTRVPAADLLMEAVLSGVIPIMYDYAATTLESLLTRMDIALDGRLAKSVGILTHFEEPGEIRLVNGHTLDIDTVKDPELREFFENITMHTLPSNHGGQVDLFLPLGCCEPGMELLLQLQRITGSIFTVPTGYLGNYNHINTEWLIKPGDVPPPALYFATQKLNLWLSFADTVQEAVRVTRKNLQPYFDQKHKDLLSKVVGQVVFDVMVKDNMQAMKSTTDLVIEGLSKLNDQKRVKPVEFLGNYLLSTSGSFGSQTMENSASLSKTDKKRYEDDFDDDDDDDDDDAIEEDLEQSEDDDIQENIEEDIEEEPMQEIRKSKTQRVTKTIPPSPKKQSFPLPELNLSLADRRKGVALEIHDSELDYMKTLDALQEVYVQPLHTALSSNRAIISAANIQTIFGNALIILEISRKFEKELYNKVKMYSPAQTLGDVFLKFCTQLKAYTNYINNYPTVLTTVERTTEQSPKFRAFLMRNDKSPSTKGLSLQDILLLPTRRIAEYIALLLAFQMHTPSEHADRGDLDQALDYLRKLNQFIADSKDRCQRELQIKELEKTVRNCPVLLEGNRHLIHHEDVANLRLPSQDLEISPELRVYQHTEMLGLFLFNDALMITRRTTKHFPFDRSVEHLYHFLDSVPLTRIKISDIPDSKYVKNAFRMATSKRKWYCSANTYENKFNWVNLMEKAIRAAVDDK